MAKEAQVYLAGYETQPASQNDCMGNSCCASGMIRKENAPVTHHAAERQLMRVAPEREGEGWKR